MNNFVDFLLMAVNLKPPPPILMRTLMISRGISDDTFNSIPGGDISCRIHTRAGILVGEFEYKVGSGSVDFIHIEEPFQNQALEQQILIYMMQDMAEAGATHIWKACWRDDVDGKFFSRLWWFQFKAKNIFKGVDTSGYIMEIPKDLWMLPIH